MVNAALIVDPSIRQVIASACDQICFRSTSTEKITSVCCSKQPEVFSYHLCSNVASHRPLLSYDFPGETRQSYSSVSCLNPWQWAQEKSPTTSFYWHPLRHAAVAAIESSAARDRHLFPGMRHDGYKFNGVDNIYPTSIGTPAKRQKTGLTNDWNLYHPRQELDPSADPELARPYLCTGYDIYLVWEPCVMCAMALIHQRIRRIFYAFPNPHEGALGSVYRLQGEKRLNHHYAVFRVLFPKEIHHTNETVAAKTSDANATSICQQDS